MILKFERAYESLGKPDYKTSRLIGISIQRIWVGLGMSFLNKFSAHHLYASPLGHSFQTSFISSAALGLEGGRVWREPIWTTTCSPTHLSSVHCNPALALSAPQELASFSELQNHPKPC